MRRHAGFTLIEMVVALAILGMLAVLIVSRNPLHSQRLDLDGATRDVAGSLRLARARAIAQDHPVRWIAGPAGFGLDGETLHALPADVALVGDTAIGFAGDGSSSGGRLVLQASGRAVVIGVDWLTGRVQAAERSDD